MLKIFLSALMLSSALFAVAQSPQKIGSYFEYDAKNGWWWYKEKYQDTNKTFVTKSKMTTKEKAKADKESEKIKLLKAQVIKLDKIKKRLDYAFPDVAPKYTKNKKTGKECLTNSDVDCFVFPLQAEAQQVPVLASWLRNPNPKNSKKWLKWQAKFFNHLDDIGYGIKFAYLSGGDKVYPTNNFHGEGDSLNSNLTDKLVTNRRTQIVTSFGDKLTTLFFLGKTSSLDFASKADRRFYNWNKRFYKKWNFYFVFESEKSLKTYNDRIMSSGIKSNIEGWINMRKRGVVVVKPEYFKKFDVTISPTTISLYTKKGNSRDKNKEVIWQKISTGDIAPKKIMGNIISFLIYNKIISPKELSGQKMQKSFYKEADPTPEVSEGEIHKETNSFRVGGKK